MERSKREQFRQFLYGTTVQRAGKSVCAVKEQERMG